MSAKTRSPIKEAPLPGAGHSLRKQSKRIWDEQIETPLIVACAAIGMAAMEWLRSFFPSPPHPWMFTFLAVAAVAFLGWRVRKAQPGLRRLRLGEEGERKVGQELEQLRKLGYEVFHDISGPGFNVDHVLVGPAGLLCIETKTWSKPVDKDARIAFDGESLMVHPTGWRPSRDPIRQASALSDWLRDLLEKSTGKDLFVRSVVLFPGWWIEQGKGTTRDVWVLEPKALAGFLAKDETRLTTEEVRMATFHLTKYVLSTLEEED